MKCACLLRIAVLTLLVVPLSFVSFGQNKHTVWLDTLDLTLVDQGWSTAQKGLNVNKKPISLGGKVYEHGIGTHAASSFYLDINGTAEKLYAVVGLDDKVANLNGVSVGFKIYGDGKLLWYSDTIKPGQVPKTVVLDLTGIKKMQFFVHGKKGETHHGHANWADIRLEGVTGHPFIYRRPVEEAVILTPKPTPKPRINGPKVAGVRPGSPFLYTIAATGQKPVEFEARNLPAELTLDKNTGRITGKFTTPGNHVVTLVAKNQHGTAERKLTIRVGDLLALTPPLGWNSWNCWGMDVDAEKVKKAADFMVSSGLADHGWSYINIDDGWQGERDSVSGHVFSDPEKFPSMKELADYIHGKGLKAGLYSSPGPLTCGKKAGSYHFEFNDAQLYAEWGYDFLKYDWCSYGDLVKNPDKAAYMKPYLTMRNPLRAVKRDIVYSLCQYGMGNVWEWGDEVNGNLWRNTNDIVDTWMSMTDIADRQVTPAPYTRPGRWNDPDMLVVGQLGWSKNLHPTKLTPNEQYYHITLWSILSAPLLLGCDLSKLDDFTLNLLTNDEVLEVNQDPAGRPARKIFKDDATEIWSKPLEDGTIAVALFNRTETDKKLSVKWSDLHITGKQKVRDLWRQQETGIKEGVLEANVPLHGTVFFKLTPVAVK